jgi:hypothetical protein
MASLAAFASAGGVLGGTVVRANAHADFFRTLDDRTSFFQALDNIQTRLGEKVSSDSHPNSPHSASGKENQDMFDAAGTSREWEAGSPVGKSTDRHASRPSSRLSPSLTSSLPMLIATHFPSPSTTVFSTQDSLGGDPSGTRTKLGDKIFVG